MNSDNEESCIEPETEKKEEQNGRNLPKDDSTSFILKRNFIALMLFLGYMNENPMRATLSISLVQMTSNKTVVNGNDTIFYEPEYNWDSKEKALLLSMYSYGAFFSVLTVHLVKRFGGCTSFVVGQVAKAVLSFLGPYVLDFNFHLFLLCELLKGLFGDVLHCSTPEIWSKWSPPGERSKLMSFTFSGLFFGAVVAYPLCGFIAYSWGWRATFYVTGAVAILWSVVWIVTVSNEPSTDRWISKKELQYLQEQITVKSDKKVLNTKIKEKHSWKRILTSVPVWVICLISYTYAIQLVLMFTYFPLYVNDMTHRDIKEVGFISAFPNIANMVLLPAAGYFVDYIQNKNILTSTQAHKILLCSGFTIGAFLLLFTASFTNFTICLISLTIFRFTMSWEFVSLKVLPVCIAPLFPSIVQSLVSFAFSLGSISGAIYIGFIVTQRNVLEWNLCFTSLSFLLVISTIAFLFFGSGEPQPLSRPSKEKDVEMEANVMNK